MRIVMRNLGSPESTCWFVSQSSRKGPVASTKITTGIFHGYMYIIIYIIYIYIHTVSGITLAAPNPTLPKSAAFHLVIATRSESPSNKLPNKQGLQSPRYHVQESWPQLWKIDRDRMAASALSPYLAHHGLSSKPKTLWCMKHGFSPFSWLGHVFQVGIYSTRFWWEHITWE